MDLRTNEIRSDNRISLQDIKSKFLIYVILISEQEKSKISSVFLKSFRKYFNDFKFGNHYSSLKEGFQFDYMYIMSVSSYHTA